jgi:hypothetical protein
VCDEVISGLLDADQVSIIEKVIHDSFQNLNPTIENIFVKITLP